MKSQVGVLISPHQLLHFNAFLLELSSKFDSSEA